MTLARPPGCSNICARSRSLGPAYQRRVLAEEKGSSRCGEQIVSAIVRAAAFFALIAQRLSKR